ncbi:hypothetical protein AVEN_208503-1 [Araneus ventricosus]|uniref:Uncharacterized protein n=1 Tax=Araneus ventricosus TaxID=182803 RepID=A0A4Y2E6A2_ARAVE|nr:hypothetical protein AVEN_208503-1 [Araneus ventricosus]
MRFVTAAEIGTELKGSTLRSFLPLRREFIQFSPVFPLKTENSMRNCVRLLMSLNITRKLQFRSAYARAAPEPWNRNKFVGADSDSKLGYLVNH